MRVNKQAFWASLIFCIICFFIAMILSKNSNSNFWFSIFTGIFSSSFLVLVTSYINYLSERNRICYRIISTITDIKILDTNIAVKLKSQENITYGDEKLLSLFNELYKLVNDLSEYSLRQLSPFFYNQHILNFFMRFKFYKNNLCTLTCFFSNSFDKYYESVNGIKHWYDIASYNCNPSKIEAIEYSNQLNVNLQTYAKLSIKDSEFYKLREKFYSELSKIVLKTFKSK